MSTDYMEEYRRWLDSPSLSEEEWKELNAIAEDKKEIENRFFAPLEFGTAGLRGTMKTGLHNMNIHIIRHATQAFADVIKAEGEEAMKKGIAIAYDCRNNSELFAREAAGVMAANGIFVRIFESLRPTPELSFAVIHYGAAAGLNITASHNPKEYNGYKVYWSDGAQLPPQKASAIAQRMEENDIFTGYVRCDFQEAVKEGKIVILGEETDELFLENVLNEAIDREAVKKAADDLRIVYTPFHGCGYKIVPEALRRLGIKHLYPVPEQMVIDGNFPTVVSPNPENAEAMTLGMKLGTKLGADLVIASDPDADRIAIVCRNDKGEWVIINGNQTNIMYHYYIINNMKRLGKLRDDMFIVKTIVTSELIRKIADAQGVTMTDEYTGFKWIANRIRMWEGKRKYIGGGEESFGFLPYDAVRDKCSPSAICLICEIAAYAKDNGMTLYDYLLKIYADYGFQRETTINVVRPGKTGAEEIQAMMVNYRNNPPQEIAGEKVVKVKDFKTLKQCDLKDGKWIESAIEMPLNATSNVLQYFTEGGLKVSVRPSGTEPKIKFYFEIPVKTELGKPFTGADYERCTAEAEAKVPAIKASLGL